MMCLKLLLLGITVVGCVKIARGCATTTTPRPEGTTEESISESESTEDNNNGRKPAPAIKVLSPKEIRDLELAQPNWTPSPDVQKKWQEWYDKFIQQENETKFEKNTSELDYEDPNRPASWDGLGRGKDLLVEPPPWAVVPEDSGKPPVCFQRRVKGICSQKILRWGYNWYSRTCEQFQYSGCGGNDNNFYSKRRCEETCVTSGVSNCLLFGRRINC